MQTVQTRTTVQTVPASPKKKVARPVPSANRVVRINGNVAYLNNDAPVKKPRPTPVPVKQAKRTKTGFISTVFVIFVAFCAMAVLISRYVTICSIGAENSAIQEDIGSIETQIDELQIDMELRDNLEYIQDTAQNQLGMTYPNETQKVKMDTSG